MALRCICLSVLLGLSVGAQQRGDANRDYIVNEMVYELFTVPNFTAPNRYDLECFQITFEIDQMGFPVRVF